MSRKKEDKSPDPGLGAVLGVGAAVVAGAALLYGAKKLFDFFDRPSEGAVGRARAEPALPPRVANEYRNKCHDSDSDEDNRESRSNSNNFRSRPSAPSSSEHGSPRYLNWTDDHQEPRGPIFSENASESFGGARPKTSAQSPLSPKRSLSDDLHDYYHNYVMISPAKMSASSSIVENITGLLSSRLQGAPLELDSSTLPTVQEIKQVGSVSDRLRVITCSEFDFHVIINLNEDNLEIESTGSGKWHIMETGLHVNGKNGEISAFIFMDSLKYTCERICSDVDIPVSVAVEVSRLGSSLRLVVGYFDEAAMTDCKLFINLRPAIIYEGKCLVPTEACTSINPTPENGGKEWRLSHVEEEDRLMDRYGPSIDTHRAVLKIFKAIRLNFPQEFGVLSSYHYKTILLHLLDDQSDENEWCDSVLSERFIDFLVELGSCCKEKLLMNFFERDVNLLENVPLESLQNLSQFINKILGRNDFTSLLEERNYGRI